MSEDKRKFRHVALEQLKLMLDFMEQHPDFASGTLRTLEARHQSKQLWGELAKILNNHRGAKKNHDGWSKVDTNCLKAVYAGAI
ncbi:Uncharacterized protein OBRU01_15763 [Operophtera brumata]|uniref:Regulatory protein zeste n=1 Tax=Operophtera brumata TaxID=104452 RepID=A0A0L7L483_OPEBR|nr:Uncharacterized protein OBRU01_15763 [Operophtera brumata]